MKKYGILIATSALAMVLAFGVNAHAIPPDDTVWVSASATVKEAADITSIAPDTISYTTVNANSFPDEGKVVITYTSNYDPWKLRIYTNNTQVPMQAAGGKYQKGGLATADGKNVAACKWVCQDDATAAPNIATIGSYNFIKDLRDEDDPVTPFNDGGTPGDPSDDTGQNESWDYCVLIGYPNIAFGCPGFDPKYSWCVDPSKPEPYHGENADGTSAVYIAGMFGTYPPAAGVYSSKIYFDLYHE